MVFTLLQGKLSVRQCWAVEVVGGILTSDPQRRISHLWRAGTRIPWASPGSRRSPAAGPRGDGAFRWQQGSLNYNPRYLARYLHPGPSLLEASFLSSLCYE